MIGIDLHLVSGDGGGRHIQQEWISLARRGSEGDWVGPKHRVRTACRYDRNCSRRRCDERNRTIPCRDFGVDTRRTKMMRIDDRDRADSDFLALLDGEVHRLDRDGMT